MPNMADITVKNAAAADVVYVAATPSGGDKIAAQWRLNASSGIAAFRPSLSVQSQNTGTGVRKVEITHDWPVTYTDPVSGKVSSLGSVKTSSVVFLPPGLTTDQWKGAFIEYGNLAVSSLIRAVVETGFAPT